MGRGKSQKTKVKEAAALSAPLLLAEKIAAQQAELKKPWELIIRERLEKFIDKLDSDQLLKLIAWGGLTYIIHQTLMGAADLVEKVAEVIQQTPAVVDQVKYRLWQSLPPALQAIFPMTEPGVPTLPLPETPAKKAIQQLNWFVWLLAATEAALILIAGPAILDMFGGVVKTAGLLLAA